MRRTITLFIVLLLLTVPGAAQVLVSTPTTASAGEEFTATVGSTWNVSYDLDVDVNGPQSTSASFTGITGAQSFSLNLTAPGTYTFNGTVTYSNGTTVTTTSQTTVTEYTALRTVALASSPPSPCPFASLHGQCRTAGIDLSATTGSNLSSDSSRPVRRGTFSVDGTTYQVRAVADGEDHDTLHIDDDTVFGEENETGEPERTVSRGETAFTVGDHSLRLIAVGSGHAALVVPPRTGSLPYRGGDDLVVTAHAANSTGAVDGLEVPFRAGRVGEDPDIDVDGETGAHGFLEPRTVTGLSSGRYAVTAGEGARSIVTVRDFDIGYSITDGSGSSTRTVEPGDTVSIEAYPVIDGERVSATSTSVSVVLPDGRTLQPSDGNMEVPDDTPAGAATVSMEVTRGGVSQTFSTDLSIRTFKVMTVPLKETEYGLQRTEGFAPGSTGYVFVGAVKLGTAGTIQELQQATFFSLENASTGASECSDNIGDVRGRMGGDLVTLNTSATSVADSSLVGPGADLPDGFSSQCIASFTVPDRTGRVSGSIDATREATGTTETGSFVFSSRRFDASGGAVDPSTGERVWQRGTGQETGIRPTVFSLDSQQQVPRDNVTDMTLVEVQGPVSNVSATFRNSSALNGPMLVLDPVGATGSYRAVFRATVNTTLPNGSTTTGTATGHAYFQAQAFDIDVSREGGYAPIGPGENVTLDIDVTEPGGSSGEAGVMINITTLYNERTGTSALDRVAGATINHTNATGDARLTLTPSSSWRTGDHRIRLTAAKDGNATTGYSFFQAERYTTQLTMNGSRGGVVGEQQNFSLTVRPTGSMQSLNHTIDLQESSLTYRGRSASVSREDVSLGPNATVMDDGLQLDTEGMRTGRYRLRLAVDVQGDQTFADTYFRLDPFDMTIERLGQPGQPVAPGGTAQYNVSFGTSREFTVSLDAIRNFGDGERYNVSSLSTPERATMTGRWGVFNISMPSSASSGFHSIRLETNASEGVVTSDEYVEVRQYTAGAPASTSYYTGTTPFENETRDQFDYYRGYNASCTNVTATNDLTIEGGTLSESHDCYVRMNDTLVSSDDYERYTVLYNNDTDRFWVSADTTLNESGDLASNISAGTFTATGHNGVRYSLEQLPTSVGAPTPDLNITVDGAFTNGVVADTTATVGGGKVGYFGSTTSPAEVQESSMRVDLNEDGDMNDSLYAVSNLSSGSVAEVWLSADMDFTSGSRATLAAVGAGGTDAGFTLYRGGMRQDQRGDKIMLYAPTSSYYPFEPRSRPNTNVTVPLLVTYPNGTALQGATVGVASVLRESTGDSIRREPSYSTTTDGNGMAFLEANLTVHHVQPAASDIGTYTIVPEVRTDRMSSAQPLDIWRSPQVEAARYSLTTGTYQSASVRLTENSSVNASQLEASSALEGVPSSQGGEYRYAAAVEEEQLVPGCFDLDDDGSCGNASVLLYNESSQEQEEGMDVNRGLIVQGTNMSADSREVFQEGWYQGPIDSLFNNTETVGETGPWSSDVRIPRDFMVFNTSLPIFRNPTGLVRVFRQRYDPDRRRPLQLGVTVTDMYDGSAPEHVNVTVIDDAGASSVNATTAPGWGTALIEIEPSDVLPRSEVTTSQLNIDTSDSTTPITVDGAFVGLKLQNVTGSINANIRLTGTSVEHVNATEGDTFSYSGIPFSVEDVIWTGNQSGVVTLNVEQWPQDEYIEINGRVSDGSGEQPFSTYVGFE